MLRINRIDQAIELGKKALTAAQERRLLATIRRYWLTRNTALEWSPAGLGWADERRVAAARIRLRQLGIRDEAERELRRYADSPKPALRNASLWELATWYSNEHTGAGAAEALRLLDHILLTHVQQAQTIPLAIMRAECLHRLGRLDDARAVLKSATRGTPDANALLAEANLHGLPDQKIGLINRVLTSAGHFPISLDNLPNIPLFDRLTASAPTGTTHNDRNDILVSVLVPVFNAEATVETALRSLRQQTWRALEILVVDDCSQDATVQVVQKIADSDPRVRLIALDINRGPYVARNHALAVASGDFVTCHDADDWSHPQRIEVQVRALLANPSMLANTSQQARTTPDLTFHRRGKAGAYVFQNMSSLIFRRHPVMARLGYWDSVRFGADSEYIRRLRQVFGESAFKPLQTGPLAFQRQAPGSLTTNTKFGFPGHFMGARNEYREAHNHFYAKKPNLYYPFPQAHRPFPVPEPMRPLRVAKEPSRRNFDVIIASDFRLDGGSTLSSIEEIKAHQKAGLKTGLVQLYRYDYPPNKPINPKIRDLLSNGSAEMVVYGESVSCDRLLLRYPPAIHHRQAYIPDIISKKVHLIVNQTPMSLYGDGGKTRYSIGSVQDNIHEFSGRKPVWWPIGPLVRNALQHHHHAEIEGLDLSPEDWVNVIDVGEWRRSHYRPDRNRLVIGRHSRDAIEKWPEDPSTLRTIYPDANDVEIRILGGADSAFRILGRKPRNWKIWKFGQLSPATFLSSIDVFVYYTNSRLVESFGRVILEALATGVPVILPDHFRPVFGKAALYREAPEVIPSARHLVSNPEIYYEQVARGLNYVESQFSYEAHIKRVLK